MMLINDIRDEDTFADDLDAISLNSRNISTIEMALPFCPRHVRLYS